MSLTVAKVQYMAQYAQLQVVTLIIPSVVCTPQTLQTVDVGAVSETRQQ